MSGCVTLKSKPAPARPILIDLQDGPCDICPKNPDKCFDCGAAGELSVGPGGTKGEHYHVTQVNGVPGREHVAMNRCPKCYAKPKAA